MMVKAPGRICLFGDHQDYLGLPIIACAINRYITITGLPNQQDFFEIDLPDIGKKRSIRFREIIAESNSSAPAINDHLSTAIKVVQPYGCVPDKGFYITITGDIPINAGLSSSSAVVVAWVQWLLTTFGCDKELTPVLVAQLAYQTEVIEQQAPGGKMDQYTAALGHILYLETDERSYFEQVGTHLEGLIIGNSGVPKDTLGLLGDLRDTTLKAIDIVKEKHPDFRLSSATIEDYETLKRELPTHLHRFLYAAIQNHMITQEAFVCFRESVVLDVKKIGYLMNAHHTVLRDALKITVPRIDTMIVAALDAGAYGAKIVGSGGGGSICALAPKGKEEQIQEAMMKAGAVAAHRVHVSKGVHIL